jgi:hypothetical protein
MATAINPTLTQFQPDKVENVATSKHEQASGSKHHWSLFPPAELFTFFQFPDIAPQNIGTIVILATTTKFFCC